MQRRDYEENNQARKETHTHTHDDKVDDDDDEVVDDDGPDGDDLDHDDLDPTKRLRKQQFHQKDYEWSSPKGINLDVVVRPKGHQPHLILIVVIEVAVLGATKYSYNCSCSSGHHRNTFNLPCRWMLVVLAAMIRIMEQEEQLQEGVQVMVMVLPAMAVIVIMMMLPTEVSSEDNTGLDQVHPPYGRIIPAMHRWIIWMMALLLILTLIKLQQQRTITAILPYILLIIQQSTS